MKRQACGCNRLRVGRRFFLLGSLAYGLCRSQPAQAHEADALVLSCIDFRFVGSEFHFLESLNLSGHYDWTALAGASLALSGFPHAEDAQAFWDQLEISRQLHHIQRVIILDHQDCGAFSLKVDPGLTEDPFKELAAHRHYLQRAAHQIQQREPGLTVESYFVQLDGKITEVFHDSLKGKKKGQ